MDTSKKITSSFSILVVIIIVGIVAGALYFTGYIMKKKVEKATGGKINIDTSNNIYKLKTGNINTEVSEGKSLTWPDNLPLAVPKYDSGKVKAVTHIEGMDVWNITISDTNEQYFKQYNNLLISNGWQASDQVNFLVSMIQLKKDGYQINVTWDTSSKGAMVTLNKIKQSN